MLLRVVIVTTLLLVAVYVEAVSEYLLPVNPLYFLIGATYALTVLHALALRFSTRHMVLGYAQIVGDLLVITGLVWITGGGFEGASRAGLAAGTGLTRAGFMLLYPISVLSGSVILFRAGGMIMAALATALYAGLLGGVWFGMLSPQGLSDIPFLAPKTLVYSVFVTGVACFTVAFVGSYLAASLRSVGEQLEEAEEQVADLQELNEVIVNSIHSGLLTCDAAGRVQTVNPFGEMLLGRSAVEVRGQPLDAVFGSRTLAPEVLRVRGTDASLARIELPYARPGEDPRQLGISVWPLSSPVSTVYAGHLLVFQDLTEIKRLEEEVRMREKLAAVGEMAARLAHEIRNPLGSISGSAQMLIAEGNVSQEQVRLLSIITRESKRLSETLSQFLFQARSSPRRIEPVDIGPVIEEAVTLLRNSPEVGAERVVEFAAEAGPYLCRADTDQILQVFWNLTRNGLEAMSRGGVLTVRLARTGREIVLSVRDQGRGFSRDERNRLFEPFHSGKRTGTGLGLAIVYRIVREHDGDISISSTPDRGTEVQVRLPMLQDPVPA